MRIFVVYFLPGGKFQDILLGDFFWVVEKGLIRFETVEEAISIVGNGNLRNSCGGIHTFNTEIGGFSVARRKTMIFRMMVEL